MRRVAGLVLIAGALATGATGVGSVASVAGVGGVADAAAPRA